jgi:hypothetical protein
MNFEDVDRPSRYEQSWRKYGDEDEDGAHDGWGVHEWGLWLVFVNNKMKEGRKERERWKPPGLGKIKRKLEKKRKTTKERPPGMNMKATWASEDKEKAWREGENDEERLLGMKVKLHAFYSPFISFRDWMYGSEDFNEGTQCRTWPERARLT